MPTATVSAGQPADPSDRRNITNYSLKFLLGVNKENMHIYIELDLYVTNMTKKLKKNQKKKNSFSLKFLLSVNKENMHFYTDLYATNMTKKINQFCMLQI